jgi:hypothetical protein
MPPATCTVLHAEGARVDEVIYDRRTMQHCSMNSERFRGEIRRMALDCMTQRCGWSGIRTVAVAVHAREAEAHPATV